MQIENTEDRGLTPPARLKTALKRIDRRSWLSAIAVGLVLPYRRLLADTSSEAEKAVRARALEVGLGAIRTRRSKHFLAIGDSSEAFLEDALKLCEGLVVDYQKQLAAKGFEIVLPDAAMTLVILGSKRSYALFNGEAIEEAEGGHYDPATNRLVIFDFRKDDAKPDAARYNTFTLVHETIHQLTYNGGVFSRTGDVPVVFSEGFATYGELWREKAPKMIGQFNRPRFEILTDPKRAADWIPSRTLLAKDGLFDDEATNQLAYAEAWLLIYHLLKTRSGAKKLRDYLDLIRDRKDASRRIEDAESIFGKLERLDAELSKTARLLSRN